MDNSLSLHALEQVAAGTDMAASIQAAEQIIAMSFDDRHFHALIRLISAPNPLVSEMALQRLEDYGEAAVEPLIEVLAQSNPTIQLVIVRALERLGSRKAVEPLMAVLKRTEYASLRYTVIQALGTLGDPLAIDLIKSFASDPDHHVRKRVQDALKSLIDES
jgi:bilin biosynthesis protein